MISVDICICTFRRPFLEQTLRSLGKLDIGPVDLRIIIADNDVSPSAQERVRAAQGDLPWPIHYVHAPASNISIARNACLEAARADFVAFIDDDETVSPEWLTALLDTAGQTGADAVLGPVKAIYDLEAPQWMARGDFHSTRPVHVDGAIRTGYTCNVLLRWSGPFSSLRFDLALGQSGGEDSDFFYRLTELGGRIVEAPDALVFEPVPRDRAAMKWLVRRKVRMGQTHGMLIRGARLPAMALAMSKAGFCLGMAGLTALSPIKRRQNLLRAMLHIGVVGGLAGVRQAIHYGDARPAVSPAPTH
jgi:succinoglycan biosynthesis protein ExoM